jgi:acyl-CoA reductase-like NAD-dependent aldehyde dehydrogenase/nicotinamidase-related amidase
VKPVLLLVDLQGDFLAAPNLQPAAGAIVERSAELLQLCRERGIPVAHIWTTVTREPDNRMAHWKQANRWCCTAGSPGHEPPSVLSSCPGELVVHKSGFSGFTSGALSAWLRDRAIDTTLIAGIHLHGCVRQTALDAYQAGLSVCIAEDAVASDDPLQAAITRRYLQARALRFLPVGAIPVFVDQVVTPANVSLDQVRMAIDRAQERARVWKRTAPAQRADLGRRLAPLLAGCAGELAELMAREIGKPVRFGRIEVERAAEMLEAIAGRVQVLPDAEVAGSALVRRRPHGVVAVITPWNNPVYLALGKIAAAVMHGNAVVWKPAPEARSVSRRILDLCSAAGWLRGLVELVEGGRYEGERLMNDSAIAAVTITGSEVAGWCAQEICTRRRIPLQAELGGNNAAIVWTDADLPEAARQVAAGALELAGQRCTANRRVILHECCRASFLRLLQESSAALRWGDPLDSATQIGPLVSTAQRERVAGMVRRALADCGPALLPHGPDPPDVAGRDDRWYPSTILCCANPNAEIVQEESFGPVLVVQTARDWDEAMRLCNGVRQGLAASIFTGSREMTERFLAEAQAGILKVNQSTADAAVDVPFGGWKASGLGPPEHGIFDLDFYTRPQTIYGTTSPHC